MIKNKNTKGKIYTALSLSLLLTLSAPMVSKASAGDESNEDMSLFYTQIFNSGMPITKSIALDEDDRAEMEYSFKDKLLELVGLDVSSPLSIVSREFNLIKDGNPETALRETETPFILNPFKLNENNIIKNTEVVPPVDYTKVAEVYDPKLKKPLNPAKPEIFIFHTHTTESYDPEGKVNYNTDPSKNMVALGEIMKKELEENYGISVVHDTTAHNVPNMNLSYTKAGKTVDKYLNQYKDFKIIIDLHRDGFSKAPSAEVSVANLNNKRMAKFMFLVGMKNPNKDKNLALARDLSKISQSLFPGLIRPGNAGDYGVYHFKTGRLNQQKNPNMLIIELGSNYNALDEAKVTSVYIARIFAEYLNRKQ